MVKFFISFALFIGFWIEKKINLIIRKRSRKYSVHISYTFSIFCILCALLLFHLLFTPERFNSSYSMRTNRIFCISFMSALILAGIFPLFERVTVKSDAIIIRKPFRKTKIYPFEEITSYKLNENENEICLKSYDKKLICVSTPYYMNFQWLKLDLYNKDIVCEKPPKKIKVRMKKNIK